MLTPVLLVQLNCEAGGVLSHRCSFFLGWVVGSRGSVASGEQPQICAAQEGKDPAEWTLQQFISSTNLYLANHRKRSAIRVSCLRVEELQTEKSGIKKKKKLWKPFFQSLILFSNSRAAWTQPAANMEKKFSFFHPLAFPSCHANSLTNHCTALLALHTCLSGFNDRLSAYEIRQSDKWNVHQTFTAEAVRSASNLCNLSKTPQSWPYVCLEYSNHTR